MEAFFESLKNSGNNNVDGLVNWMKEANLLDGSKSAEDKVRGLFAGADPKNIALEKFKEVIQKFASDQNIGVGYIMEKLTDSGGRIVQSLTKAGTKALKNWFGRKDRDDDNHFHNGPGEATSGPAPVPQSAPEPKEPEEPEEPEEPPPASSTQEPESEPEEPSEIESSEPVESTDNQSSNS